MHEKTNCAICAWRETCQKKFSVSGKDIRCIDYVKDLTIKGEKTEDKENKKAEKK
ncbi:MAG: hypothetical protein HZB61_04590 [Nitrospirae bacterium]|nr:hypothetical protein [Nitrospirota bacterium]